MAYAPPAYYPPYAVPPAAYIPPTFAPPPLPPPSADTARIQHMLNELTGAGIEEDGVYGPATADAVSSFQAANGLAVNGVVGGATWAVLQQQMDAQMSHVAPVPPPAMYRDNGERVS